MRPAPDAPSAAQWFQLARFTSVRALVADAFCPPETGCPRLDLAVLYDSTGIHFPERHNDFALPFLGQTDIGLDRFLDQPPARTVQQVRQPVQSFGELFRRMRRDDPGPHGLSPL